MVGNFIFVVVLVVVILALVLWIASISRRAKVASAASDARLAQQLQAVAEDLPKTKSFADETPAERSAAVIAAAEDDPAPGTAPGSDTAPLTKEARLAELTELHDRGLITDGELSRARAKILAE